LRTVIEEEKDAFPFLVKLTDDGKKIFKKPEPFIRRLDHELRLKYYHLYRFTSLFIHPGPKLKEVFLKRSVSNFDPSENIIEPTKQILAYTLLFEELILGYGCKVFLSYNKDNVEFRNKLYSEMVFISDKANNGYYGKPK